jgi:formyltetrahydrofolate-dependent phosphoribosylglycinamide formyltransferase
MPDSLLKLAVLVSGSGTTLQNLIDEIAAGRLNAKIAIVVASRAGLVGTDRAVKAGIPNVVVSRKDFTSVTDFSREVFHHIDAASADLVCLAGWLCLLDLPERYAHRAINIHPALLPSFGGKGMYGAKVHEAVINHGCKISGCTVHFLDNAYDTGPIIVQRTCPVLDDDTPAALAHRVFEEEKIAYPEAIRLFQAGRLRVEGRRVRLVPSPGTPGEG